MNKDTFDSSKGGGNRGGGNREGAGGGGGRELKGLLRRGEYSDAPLKPEIL